MSSSTTQEPRRSRRLRGGRPSYPGGEVVISASKAIAMEQIDNGEEVADDDLCPICQLLLYRPVTTECGHTMCEACMAHWAEVSVLHMPIVDVDEVPESFNAVTGLQAKCPMCRTQTPATLNAEMAQRLEKAYPLTWRERKVEDEVGEQGSVQTLTVYIGNRHRVITTGTKHKDGSSNSHEWTFFVRPSRTDIIKEVQILLVSTSILRCNSPIYDGLVKLIFRSIQLSNLAKSFARRHRMSLKLKAGVSLLSLHTSFSNPATHGFRRTQKTRLMELPRACCRWNGRLILMDLEGKGVWVDVDSK